MKKFITILMSVILLSACSSQNIKQSEQQTAETDEISRAEAILNSMTLEEKINQLFIITPEALTAADVVLEAGAETKEALEKHPVGGLIYFTQNIESEQQIKQMLKNTKNYAADVCKLPLFISIDEEGGAVARLGSNDKLNISEIQNMSEIGRTGDSNRAYEVGVTIGKYLSEYGFNIDFAPVADVLTNSDNTVVKDRSFGSDAQLVSEMAVKVSAGLNSQGVYSCYKHFPGHGATRGDTHEGFAYTDKNYEELMQNELVPFKAAVENNADFIMVGHISLPNIIGDETPASISKKAIDILKNDMGYKGIVITDALNMGALTNLYESNEIAVRTIEAGADMLLMPEDFALAYEGVLNAVKIGRISEERINESVLKIIDKKLQQV